MTLTELKEFGEAPEWMTSDGYKTLQGNYLLTGETPRSMYRRVACAAARQYPNSEYWETKFFDAMWSNWLCLASPVASNLGSDRALPISCNSISVGDSLYSIFSKCSELAMLTKNGAGVGIYMGRLRGRGEDIKGNGKSEGVVPWAKIYDQTISSVSQGAVRRGAAALYLPIEHKDAPEFLNIRRPVGDQNRRCLNINHGVCITNKWMQELLAGNEENRNMWEEILKARVETGEPYLFFEDSANEQSPECYKANGLYVETSNICCLSGDTLVATFEGPARIDSLIDKDVVVWDGENWVHNNSFSQRGEDSLVRIHLKDGSHVDSNANHRWFVSKSYNDIRAGKLHAVTTSELAVKQWVEFFTKESHGKTTTSGAYIKGFLLGDGTSIKDRPLLNVHSTKYMCLDKLLASAEELPIGKKSTNVNELLYFSEEVENPKAWGKQIFKVMKGLTLRKDSLIDWVTTYRHCLPEEVFVWDKPTKLEFLAGLFDADGTVSKSMDQIQYTSIHEEFINRLYLLLKTMGYTPGIDCDSNRQGGKSTYRITLGPTDGHHLLKVLPSIRIRPSGFVPQRKTTGFRQIVKIEKLSGIHPVYCPTLPTTGKFGLANGLMTGNTEIMLHTDPDHSFVCCLSSLNLVRYDEWKDTDLVNTAVRFLDAVISEYIQKAENIPGLECSRRSAIKGRAIGVGVLGWHSLLQERGIPFDSFEAMQLNAEIFRTLRAKAEEETSVLARELGEPEWCRGFGRRNTHLLAVAPTVSNSIISGGHSAGIEPLAANIYTQQSAKGTFIRKNPTLERLLEVKGKNNQETWTSILSNDGSVQHLDFLTENEKAVFLTAREINQHAIIKQAAQRQRWIDQGQSVNLFFSSNSDPKYIHEVHLAAWEAGLKSLYYLRTTGVLKGDLASRSKDECAACEA